MRGMWQCLQNIVIGYMEQLNTLAMTLMAAWSGLIVAVSKAQSDSKIASRGKAGEGR